MNYLENAHNVLQNGSRTDLLLATSQWYGLSLAMPMKGSAIALEGKKNDKIIIIITKIINSSIIYIHQH